MNVLFVVFFSVEFIVIFISFLSVFLCYWENFMRFPVFNPFSKYFLFVLHFLFKGLPPFLVICSFVIKRSSYVDFDDIIIIYAIGNFFVLFEYSSDFLISFFISFVKIDFGEVFNHNSEV